MAIMEIKREWSPCQLDYVKTFLLHSEADVKNLPKCCVGSKATVSETDNEYFCTESGWKLGSELDGGSAPVVILPETGLTVDGDGGGGEAMILTPLSAFPEVGGTCEVTYNGTAYDCPVISAPMNGAAAVALGNTEALELGAGNSDAPFAVVLFPNAAELGEVVAYGACVPMDGATTITLSIVQTEGAASGGDDTGIFTAHAMIEDLTTTKFQLGEWDTTYGKLEAAFFAGRMVQVICTDGTNTIRGVVNAAYVLDNGTQLRMDVPRGVMTLGYFNVALYDDGSGGVACTLLGQVID